MKWQVSPRISRGRSRTMRLHRTSQRARDKMQWLKRGVKWPRPSLADEVPRSGLLHANEQNESKKCGSIVVKKENQGVILTVRSQKDNWYQIETPDHVIGWVLKGRVMKEK